MHTSLGNKWVTAETIMAKLARNYKALEFDPYDVIEWCAECTKNIADFDGFQRFHNVPVQVINRRALLPCNIWRLLHVTGNNCAVYNYDNDGTYLRFQRNSFVNNLSNNTTPPENETVTLFIEFIGIPVDPETGYPLVKEGHEEACYWYCLTKLLFEEYLNGRIDNSRWEFIQNMYGNYVTKAKSSFQFVSRDDMEKFNMAAMNLVPKLKFPRNLK
ncbi:MAG: hypothetical protein ABIW84_01580 [Ilumatobacteraceae bacterium]